MLKMQKSAFAAGALPQTPLGTLESLQYSALPDHLALLMEGGWGGVETPFPKVAMGLKWCKILHELSLKQCVTAYKICG